MIGSERTLKKHITLHKLNRNEIPQTERNNICHFRTICSKKIFVPFVCSLFFIHFTHIIFSPLNLFLNFYRLFYLLIYLPDDVTLSFFYAMILLLFLLKIIRSKCFKMFFRLEIVFFF